MSMTAEKDAVSNPLRRNGFLVLTKKMSDFRWLLLFKFFLAEMT